MAKKKSKPKREKKVLNISPADTPSASELFVQPPVDTELCDGPASEITEKTPAISHSAKTTANTPAQSFPKAANRPTSVHKSTFVITQRVLIVGITLSSALLIYSSVFSPSSPQPPSKTHVSKKQPAADTERSDEPASASNSPRSQIANKETLAAQPQAAHKETDVTPPQVSPASPQSGGRGLAEGGQKDANKPTVTVAAFATAASRQKKEEANSAGGEANQRLDKLTVPSTVEGQTQPTEEQPVAQTATATNPQFDKLTAPSMVEGQSPESSPKTEPLSLGLVDEYFTAKDYVRTYNACNKLRQNLSGKEFELVRDFLYLRMAICIAQKSNHDKANEMFRAVSESPSITLKALANYNLCLLEMDSGQYLKARTRAYKTVGLTGAIASDYKWALTLERNCQFLAAEAIARQVLSLSDADKDLPRQLWYREEEKDPLTGLNEVELQKVLSAGIERFNTGLLAPQIKSVESIAGSPALARWSVVCNGPGIEELMARFASNAGIDVKWARHIDNSSTAEQQSAGWNRPVCLYLPTATIQQVASIATGAVGLLAQINDTNGIIITDPTEYYALSEHTRMLNEYSIWLWRKLMMMYSDDRRIANAHFVLGVLQEQKGQTSEAISEYKLVANRYAKTSLAPVALLHSSRLKTSLRDYPGASRDLKQLIEQYPENELIGQAYLNLAETTMKAGLYEQACSQYKKAYALALSTEFKAIATLGAGKCYYQQKEYEPALKWLSMYLETVDAQQLAAKKSAKPELQNNPELYTAYLLLGKTHLALGNLQQACEALERTVKKANGSDDYAEAIATLAETQMKQHDFVTALKTVENVRPWSFSQEQTTRLILLKSEILRESGLVEQASALLADRIQYLTDAKLKAYITIEMARCEIAANHLDLARSYLTDAISSINAGPDAQRASLDLAEVCLKLKDYRQTISICKQLLDSLPPEQIKQKASRILSAAYSSQKNYDNAAMALLASPTIQSTTKEKKTDTSEK